MAVGRKSLNPHMVWLANAVGIRDTRKFGGSDAALASAIYMQFKALQEPEAVPVIEQLFQNMVSTTSDKDRMAAVAVFNTAINKLSGEDKAYWLERKRVWLINLR